MNNKILTAAIVLTALVLFPSMNARANVLEDQISTDVTYNFSLTPAISHITYEEPDFMEDSGLFYGLAGDYTVRFPEHLAMIFEGRLAYGLMDYTSNGTGSSENTPNILAEIRALLGFDYYMSDATRLTPYVGFGYRYLLDQSGGTTTTTGHYGYDREANYSYLPVGAKLLTQVTDKWSWGITGEFDYLLNGKQITHLEDVDSGYNTLSNTQKNGWGMRGSVQLMAEVSEFDLLVEPYIHYWNIDDSDFQAITYSGTPTGYSGIEPANNTVEYGLKLGAQF